ncbi:VgrG-related protein [Nodosilinea sp. E11]|uniref:VgrG-related protein n=1 Tax=Nodosilinea sp. E11 TaxID=3037479 RepID=UPI0029352102|nr:VgrG-related protein [Nodosilinea sp. E11]WOD37080.1 VgrG-related protein [Nodosilinea sp. E11]
MPAISYIAKPIIKIDGAAVGAAFLEDILQISVEESLHLPGMFTLMLRNDYLPGAAQDKAWKHQSLLAIGKSVELGFISSAIEADEFDQAAEGLLLKGEITAIETHFTHDAQAPILVRGYDVSHRLHRGRHSRSFQNKTDADIVRQIASEVGIPTGAVDATGGPYGYGDIGGASGYIFQENQTNMEFLRSRAARHGYELFVQDGTLHFRKPKKDGTLKLAWLKELQSFRVQVTSAEQVSSVEVRGWDYSQKKAIVETSTSTSAVLTATDQGKGNKHTTFQGKPSQPKLIVVDQVTAQAPEAKTMADALCNELGGEFVQADARSDGNPLIRPGKVVELTNMDKYSGTYYVTATRHVFSERVYTTEFSVRGLRGGDLLQILTPAVQLMPGQTCLIGIVADNKDPKGWGRVRVKFPTLTEEHMSNWARMVAVGAGVSRGFDCLPEINDEVLVAFEHGDIHRPYVLGGVWNGKDAPPEKVEESIGQDGKVRLRTFKTRLGHQLQFVEEDKGDSKQGVYLTTKGSHHLDLNDTEKHIEIKSTDGHQALLDDKNKKLELKSKGGHLVCLNDSGTKIDMTSTGDLNLKSGTSGASRAIDVKGGTITLTGTTKITLKVGSSSITLSNAGIEIKGIQITAQATAQAKLQGMTVDVQGSALTKIQGAVVKIN